MSLATLSGPAVIATSSGTTTPEREWWRHEAARLGSDWNAIMELRASVAPLTCRVCGAAPCVTPSFCAACRVADQQTSRLARRNEHRPTPRQREISRITVPDEHALLRLVRLVAEAGPGERNKLTYWAACRTGEMVASGLLDADAAAAVMAEAATRAGLPRLEAERTAWSGIRRTGGPHA
jgi:hypothetical protein